MRRSAAFLLVIATVLYSLAAFSAETGTDEGAGSRFTVVILGTRNADDVKVIEKNLRKLPQVKLFVPTMVSQQHLEFEGSMTTGDDAMIADVQSLAQDRYDVVAKRESKRGLVITLRKIKE